MANGEEERKPVLESRLFVDDQEKVEISDYTTPSHSLQPPCLPTYYQRPKTRRIRFRVIERPMLSIYKNLGAKTQLKSITKNMNRIGDERFAAPNTPTSAMFSDRLCKFFLMVYAIWIAFIDLKFENGKQSPFKTQGFFCIMSPVALCVALSVFWISSCTNDFSNKPNIVHMILRSLVCFLGILAHLSLLLVLLIPPKLNWIGYVIICVLLVVVIAYTFSSHIKSLGDKGIGNLGAHQSV